MIKIFKNSNKIEKNLVNSNETCLSCPAIRILGTVNFNVCCQSLEKIIKANEEGHILIRCSRRPELGLFEPSITFQQCTEWIETKNRYVLKKSKDLHSKNKENGCKSEII